MKIVIPFSIVSAMLLNGSSVEAKNNRLNVLVFIADDLGMDLGCFGNHFVKTPNIDKLASEGVAFENAFVTSPQSSPSRISMMTGVYAHTLGVEDLHTPIGPDVRMIPSYLKEAGYYTGSILKTHWGDNGTKQFDFYYNGGGNLYSEKYLTASNPFMEKFRSFLDNAGDDPFFLWVGFIDPHRPYKEPNIDSVHSPDSVNIHPSLRDTRSTREDIVDYYDEIHRLDQHIGTMLAELDRRKLRDDTVVIFLSDNGLPFIRAKGFLYDTGIHIPMIASCPGVLPMAKTHNNGLVSTIDIAPTILDICGCDVPENMVGTSLFDIIRNPEKEARPFIFAERNHHDTEDYARCIRTEQYKLIINGYPEKPRAILGDMMTAGSWWDLLDAKSKGELDEVQKTFFECPYPAVELYDVQSDPLEINNLAYDGDYVGIVKQLLKQIRLWQDETLDCTDYRSKEKKDIVDRLTGMPLELF